MYLPVELLCAGVAFLVYANTFDADFVYDDNRAILKNLDVQTKAPLYNVFLNDFWGTRMTHSGSHKSYRPVTILTFRLNYAISGFRPWSYHLLNVFLHSLTTFLFVIFVKLRIFREKKTIHKSRIAGLLFAVHPIHTEAVAGVVGRADILSCLFVLATLLSYSRHCDVWNFNYPRCNTKKTNYPKEKAIECKVTQNQSQKRNVKFRKKEKRKNCNTNAVKELDNIKEKNLNKTQGINFHQTTKQTNLKNTNAFHNVLKSITEFTVTSSLLPYLFALCAILSKEHGACALPLCAVYDIWIKNELGISTTFYVLFYKMKSERLSRLRKRVWKLLFSTIILLTLRILPWHLLSSSSTTISTPFSTADNPASTNDSILVRTLTFHYLLFFNIKLLILPTKLSYDWGSIPLVESIWDARNICTLTFYTILTLLINYVRKSLQENDRKNNLAKRNQASKEFSKKKYPISSCQDHIQNKESSKQLSNHSSELLKALFAKNSAVDRVSHNQDINRMSLEIKPECLGETSCKVYTVKNFDNNGNENEDLAFVDAIHTEHEARALTVPSQLATQTKSSLSKYPCECPESTNSSGYATESGEESMEAKVQEEEEKVHEVSKTPISQQQVEILCSFQQKNANFYIKPSNKIPNPVLMAIAMMIIPFLPATNLFFYVGFVVAERLLYLPSAGFCILVAVGWDIMYTRAFLKIKTEGNKYRFKKLMTLCGIIFLLALSSKTFIRNRDWSNEFNLYKSGVMTSPAKSWANLGNVLKVQGRIKEAEFSYLNALEERKNMADVHYNLGLLYQEQRQYAEALKRYQKAIQYRPTLAVAHLNTGIILSELGRFEEAEQVYRHTSTIDDTGLRDPQGHARTKISALYNLGCMLSAQGQYQKSVDAFKDAVQRRSSDYEPHSLFNMLGQALSKLNRFEESEKWFKEVLNFKPDHVPAHLTYATLLSRIGRLKEAENLYKKAIQLEPQNHIIYIHFGKFLIEHGRIQEAAKVMQIGAMTSSGSRDYDTLMTAGDIHRHAQLHEKSEMYYKIATQINPKAIEAVVNLGGVLHLQQKYMEARQSYQKALRLKPGDPTATDNLRKVEDILKRKRTGVT